MRLLRPCIACELRSCTTNERMLLDNCANSIKDTEGNVGTTSLWEWPSLVCHMALHFQINPAPKTHLFQKYHCIFSSHPSSIAKAGSLSQFLRHPRKHLLTTLQPISLHFVLPLILGVLQLLVSFTKYYLIL